MKNKKTDSEKLIKEKKTVYENVTVKEISLDQEEGVLEAVVATDETDRDGERLDIASLDVDTYMKNNIVAWSHDYKKLAIAKTLQIRKEMRTGIQVLIAKMKFAIDESPFAKEVYNLYKNGFMKAFSIGFIPKQYDLESNKWMNSEMIEYSAVLIGSNRNALVEAKSKGLSTCEIEKQMEIDKENNICHNNISEDEQKPKVKESPEDQTESPDHQEKSINEKKESKKMNLKELLAKAVSELTIEEADYLRFKVADLSAEDKEKFKSLFKEDALAKEVADLKAKLELPKSTKNVNDGQEEDKPKTLSKELHTVLWLKGVKEKNFSDLKKAKEAAGYMNTTDESPLIPPAEFVADILRLEREYGVARRFAGYRGLTTSSEVELTLGDQSVTISKVGEAQPGTSSKNTYKRVTVSVDKYFGLAPLTYELEADSAIDIYNDVLDRFARAFAAKEDALIFTDATTGIVNQTGVHESWVGSTDAETIDWLVLNRAMYSISGSITAGQWYANPTMIGVLTRIKDKEDRPIFLQSATNGFAGTVFGRPVIETEALPAYNAEGQTEDEALLVYGNLKNAILVEKDGMRIDYFNAGTVEDADGNDLNLIQNDMACVRNIKRMNAKTVFPEGFAVIRAGTEGS